MLEDPSYQPYSSNERTLVANYMADVLADKGLTLDGDLDHVLLVPIRLSDFRRLIGTLNDDVDHASKPIGTILETALGMSESRLAPVILTALDMMDDDDLVEFFDNIRFGLGGETRQPPAEGLPLDVAQRLSEAGIPMDDLDLSKTAVIDVTVLDKGAEIDSDALTQDHVTSHAIGHEKAQRIRQDLADRLGIDPTQVFLRGVIGNPEAVPEAIPADTPIAGSDPGDETSDPVSEFFREEGLELMRRLTNKSPPRR